MKDAFDKIKTIEIRPEYDNFVDMINFSAID